MKAAAQAKSRSSGKKEKESEKEKGDKEKGDREEKKTERQHSRHGRSSVPFHRRQAQLQDDLLQFDMERVMSHLPPNPAFLPTGSTTIPPQGGSTPVPEGPIDTPNSAPSPLDPPPNLPSLEPTMPTLSPHPPSNKLPGGGGGGGGNTPVAGGNSTGGSVNNNSNSVSAGGGGEGGGCGSAGGGGGGGGSAMATGVTNGGGDKDSTCHNVDSVEQTGEPANPLPSGSLNSEFLPKSEELTCGQGAATPQPKAAVIGGAGTNGPVLPDSQLPWSAKKERVSSWLQSQQRCVENTLKRPTLPTDDSDEEGDLVLATLYDRHTTQSWLVLCLVYKKNGGGCMQVCSFTDFDNSMLMNVIQDFPWPFLPWVSRTPTLQV